MLYYKMWKEFKELCFPAKFYFVFAILSILFGLFTRIPVLVLFIKLLVAFIYTYFLNFLCNKGYKYLSWFLVLLPYIVIIFSMI
jgi:hypothetical protein